MSNSKVRDTQLEQNIKLNTAKKNKYERVKKSIEINNLHYGKQYDQITSFIDRAKNTLSKIDGNAGYGYLSNFREKLATEIKTLEEYRDFIQYSANSFKQMHATLESMINSLNISINNDKKELNQGHIWPFN